MRGNNMFKRLFLGIAAAAMLLVATPAFADCYSGSHNGYNNNFNHVQTYGRSYNTNYGSRSTSYSNGYSYNSNLGYLRGNSYNNVNLRVIVDKNGRLFFVDNNGFIYSRFGRVIGFNKAYAFRGNSFSGYSNRVRNY